MHLYLQIYCHQSLGEIFGFILMYSVIGDTTAVDELLWQLVDELLWQQNFFELISQVQCHCNTSGYEPLRSSVCSLSIKPLHPYVARVHVLYSLVIRFGGREARGNEENNR